MSGSDILVKCVYVIVQVNVNAYLGMQEHTLQEKLCLSQKCSAIRYK